MRRVTFDGRADFDARCLLLAWDAAAARRIFTPRVIDDWVAEPGWFLEGRGDQWLVYRLSERVSARGIPAFPDRAIGLIARFAGR